MSVALLSSVGAIMVAARPGSTLAAGEQFVCHGPIADIVGTTGDDVLSGTTGSDVIVGRGGNDVIIARGGRDRICGNDGNDRLYGGGSHDFVDGGAGRDRLSGGNARDRLFGRGGRDLLRGGLSDDRLDGGGGTTDFCNGQAGTDGGVRCERSRSIALLRFEAVTLRRFPTGSSTCRLNVVIRNVGKEPAEEVEVEGRINTVAPPMFTANVVLDGPSEIEVNLDGPIFSNEQFFVDTPFAFPQGGLMKYTLRVHNGDTSVDSRSEPFGIVCTG